MGSKRSAGSAAISKAYCLRTAKGIDHFNRSGLCLGLFIHLHIYHFIIYHLFIYLAIGSFYLDSEGVVGATITDDEELSVADELLAIRF